MSPKRIVSRIGTSVNVPSLRQGEMGFDTDTKVFRVGDDTATPPGILTSKTEAFDLSNLKDLQLSAEVLDYLAKTGSDGWTPVLATETFHDRELLKVIDWVDGTGDKPEFPVYVSNTGFTTNPALATNVRGKKGSDASGPVISFSIENGNLYMNVLNPDETMGPITGSINDDGHLILEYEPVSGTTLHTDLGKILVRARGEYQGGIYYHSLDEVSYNNKLYRVKADSDPVINILPIDTNHWTLVYSYALGGTYSVQVDNLSGRDAYDTEEEGFSVLVSDSGDGRAAVYSRVGASGNWTDPAYFTGKAGSAYESYGVSIYNEVSVVIGEYYVDRYVNADSIQDTVYGEVLAGDAGAEVDVFMQVNGNLGYGPFTISYGSPFSNSSAGINLSEGDSVSWVISRITGGAIQEIFLKSYGAIS